MFRLSLVIPLILAALASPLVCCCAQATAGTGLAAKGLAAKGLAAKGRTGDRRQAGCCSHHHGSGHHRSGHHGSGHHGPTAKTKNSSPHTPKSEPCRCTEHGHQPVATAESSSIDLNAFLRLAGLFYDSAAVDLTLDVDAPLGRWNPSCDSRLATAFPHLSARQILSVLQTLRC